MTCTFHISYIRQSIPMFPKVFPAQWYALCGVVFLVSYFRYSNSRTIPKAISEPASSSALVQDLSPFPNEFPKIIHQSWKTCDGFERPAHDSFTTTWKANHPQWKYQCWNDADNRALIESQLPQYLTLYDSFPKEIYRVDFARAAYMYVYGGVYADYDFVSVKPLDPLLRLLNGFGIILGTMGRDNFAINSIPNALMVSKARHPFWLEYMEVMRGKKDQFVVLATGPGALRNAIVKWYGERPLNHPGEYSRILNGSKVMSNLTAQPLYVAPGGMFYPLIWGKGVYENFCCPREVCLNGRDQTSCEMLSSIAKTTGNSTAAEFVELRTQMASCTLEMCQDTYAYTVWLGTWI